MAYPAKPTDSLFDYVTSKLGDVAITGAKGVVGLGQAAVGLADIPTGGAVGRFIEQNTPIDLEAAQQYLGKQYTPDVQQGMQEIGQAEGFMGTIGAAIQNPEATAHIVGESLVGTKGAMLFGKGVGKLAAKTAGKMEGGLAKKVLEKFGGSPLAQSAFGEGAMMGGVSAENIRYQTPDRELTPEQSLLATGVGVAGGGLGMLGGKVAEKLGVVDPDVLLAGGNVQPVQKGLLKNIAGSAVSEGVFEELPQSVLETATENVALDRPMWEGVPEAAGMGMVAGAVMGGSMAAVTTPFQNKMIALDQAKKEALDEVIKENDLANEAIVSAKTEDIVAGVQSTSLLPAAPTLDESLREQKDIVKSNVLTEEAAQEISGIEAAAQVADQEVEKELPEVVRTAATEHGVKPTIFHQTVETIYKAAKNFKEFSVGLVKQFGETIKKYALQLYQNFKKSIVEAQPGLSTKLVGDEPVHTIRASYERLKAEQEDRQRVIKDPEYRAEVAARYGITPQEQMQRSIQGFNNNLKNFNKLKAQVSSPAFVEAERKALARQTVAAQPVQEPAVVPAAVAPAATIPVVTAPAVAAPTTPAVAEEVKYSPAYIAAHSTKPIPSEAKINVYSTEPSKFRGLSNFADAPIKAKIGGKEVVYKTPEHYYQFAKAGFFADKETALKILAAPNAYEAQKLGRTVKGFDEEKWNEVAGQQLEAAMRKSLEQNPEKLALLKETGVAQLTHISPKGAKLGKWEEEFPRILMKLRNEFFPPPAAEKVPDEYAGLTPAEARKKRAEDRKALMAARTKAKTDIELLPQPSERRLRRVISGGQAGVDITALEVAKELGLLTGGTAGAKFAVETETGERGNRPELAELYGMKAGEWTLKKGKEGEYWDAFHHRTIANAQEADATIWFGDEKSPGGITTLSKKAQKGKPAPLVNPGMTEKQKEARLKELTDKGIQPEVAAKTVEREDIELAIKQTQEYLKKNRVQTINIAGNRPSINAAAAARARAVLTKGLLPIKRTVQESRALKATLDRGFYQPITKPVGKEIGQKNQIPIVRNDKIISAEGTEIHIARRDGKIHVNEKLMQKVYEVAQWAKPRILRDGTRATALPENIFQSYDEFVRFSLEHEAAHFVHRPLPGESRGAYETRINSIALEAILTPKEREAYYNLLREIDPKYLTEDERMAAHRKRFREYMIIWRTGQEGITEDDYYHYEEKLQKLEEETTVADIADVLGMSEDEQEVAGEMSIADFLASEGMPLSDEQAGMVDQLDEQLSSLFMHTVEEDAVEMSFEDAVNEGEEWIAANQELIVEEVNDRVSESKYYSVYSDEFFESVYNAIQNEEEIFLTTDEQAAINQRLVDGTFLGKVSSREAQAFIEKFLRHATIVGQEKVSEELLNFVYTGNRFGLKEITKKVNKVVGRNLNLYRKVLARKIVQESESVATEQRQYEYQLFVNRLTAGNAEFAKTANLLNDNMEAFYHAVLNYTSSNRETKINELDVYELNRWMEQQKENPASEEFLALPKDEKIALVNLMVRATYLNVNTEYRTFRASHDDEFGVVPENIDNNRQIDAYHAAPEPIQPEEVRTTDAAGRPLRGTIKTIAIQEKKVRGKLIDVLRYREFNTDIKGYLRIALEKEIIDEKTYDSFLERLEEVGQGETKDDIKFYRDLIAVKTKVALEQHKRQQPLDPETFEQMAKTNADLGLSAADFYQEYLKVGSEIHLMYRRINEMREIKQFQEKHEKLLEVNRAKTIQEKEEKIKEFVEYGLTEEERTRYAEYLETEDRKTFTTKERKLFSSLEQAEINLRMQQTRMALKQKSIQNESVATSKAHNYVMPDLADYYQIKPENKLTDFEKSLQTDPRVHSIGRLQNPIVHAFYRLVAKAFGADLVIVAAHNYTSRYAGEAFDGRPKIIVNVAGNSDEASFHHVFTHELFHHVVNKANPKAYQAFADEVKNNIATHEYKNLLAKKKEDGVVGAEEEVLAEIFAQVMFDKEFYFNLAKTFHGKGIAGTLVARLVKNADTLLGVLSSPSNPGFSYENQLIIENSQMAKMHDLFLSLVGSAFENHQHSFKVNHKGVRFFTPGEAVNELKGYAEAPAKWVQGQWQSVAPNGTKNKTDLMTSIENLIKKLLGWVKDNVTNSMWAHFMVDPQQMKLVHKIAYTKNLARAKANAQAVQKNLHAFKGMTEDQLRVMHDHFVRGVQTIKVYNPKTKQEEDRVQQIEPLDVGTTSAPNEAGVKRALEFGYSQEVIAAFQSYKEITDKIYAQLLKIYPDLGENPTHYGQSIRWLRDDILLDPDFDWAIGEEQSVLEGNKRYLKQKSMTKRTKDIEIGYNVKPATMNPHMMFLDYVADATQLLSLHSAINEGLVTRDKNGLPIARVFRNQVDAAIHGYVPVDDNGLKTFGKMNLKTGFNVVVDGEIYEEDGQPQIYSTLEEAEVAAKRIVSNWAKRGVEVNATPMEVKNATLKQTSHYTIRAINKQDGSSGLVNEYTFREKAKADQYVARLNRANKDPNLTFETHAVLGTAQTAGVVSQVYFLKDTANLLNLLMARDPLRNGRWFGMSGRKIMSAKNMQTSVEFAFSLFHAMTITQEVFASYSSWYNLKNKGRKSLASRIAGGFNPNKIIMETREISAILESSLSDPEVANHPKTQQRLAELLGTSDVNALDLIKQYYLVGGLLGQDSSLRSSVHDLGTGMRYVKEPDVVKIINGEPVFVPNNLIGSATEIPGMVSKSINEVHKEALAREPDKKIKAMFKTGLYTGLEAPTAFLMEYGIPRVKLATWAREYTLGLERNKAKIDAGTILPEQIAHETILFVEDRFGEVNWQNNWLKPWMKTSLQFLFRSFTWFTGSWKAFAKAGIDVGKWGWFKMKGEEYEITEKGWWAINAFISHMLMAGLVTAAYQLAVAIGGGEVPDDEETPLLTKLIFPRVDRFDPEARVTIPSYITEGYKIMRHLAIIGHEFEPSKMITGRFNSFIGRGYEALWSGEDWRGVSITDRDDNIAEKAAKKIWHIAAVPPISVSSGKGTLEAKGTHGWRQASLAAFGFTDAPAAAKRPEYENVAFAIRREEYKGRELEQTEMEEKDALKRAMYAYSRGDKTEIDRLLAEGRVSPRQYQLALSKIPTINGEPNPKFKSRYQQAIKGLTLQGALETWEDMPKTARAKYRKDIIKKYSNMMARKDHPPEYKKQMRDRMFELGILQ